MGKHSCNFGYLLLYACLLVGICKFIFKFYRPLSITEDGSRDTIESEQSTPVKLDASAQTHIQKHRYCLGTNIVKFLPEKMLLLAISAYWN